jgi:hypothetical protein
MQHEEAETKKQSEIAQAEEATTTVEKWPMTLE